MRVQTRHLLVDSAIALVLGWICFWGAHGLLGSRPWSRRSIRSVRPGFGPPRIELPEVADWVAVPLLLLVVGLAVRRIWPRSAFVAIVLGVGGYLAAGAVFPPVFLAPALGIYAMATGPAPAPLGAADRAAGADDHGRPLVGALSRAGQPRAVRRTGGGRRRGRGAGHGRAAPAQPPGERPAPTRAGPAPIRVRGAAADRPGCARRGRPQPVGDHHAGRRRPARAGQAPRPGGGVPGGDPDDQSGGPGGTADDPGGLPGSGGRRGPGSGAGPGPARRPGRRPAPGGPDGRGGAGTGR